MKLHKRTRFLKLVTRYLLHAHDDYQQYGSTQVQPNHPLWIAAHHVIDAFSDGTIPGELRQLHDAVRDFAAKWRKYAEAQENRMSPDWEPTQEVWAGIEAIASAYLGEAQKASRKLETIEELIEQGLNETQIALNRKWKTPAGQPDLMKARDAMRNPEKYNSPEESDPQARRTAERAHDQETLLEQLEADERIHRPLAAEGVHPSVPAAAGPPPHVLAQYEGVEAPLGDPEGDQSPLEVLGLDDNPEWTVEQQVLHAVDAGIPHTRIAEAFPDISRQKVTAIVSRRDEIQQPA